MSIYKGTQLISGVATPIEAGRNIGQIIQSLLPITDAGLHLLDGTLISGNGIYKLFVDYISKLDLTASYFTTEADWQASVTQYGVCGKFVYDASANTVRLPKVTGLVEGTIDASALGDLVEAGLPNITGSFTDTDNLGSATGAFSYTGISGRGHWNSNDGQHTINFNASRSNPIYGNSTTVQPQTIKGYYYIVVATSAKTDFEVDIDNIVTELNQKVDISNMVEVPIIIETYINGTSWYRVWSDGWCEQGGRCTASSQTITFLKPFTSTNYTITAGLIPGTTSATYEHLNIGSLTTKSFYYTAFDGYQLMWKASGYRA